MDGHFYEVAIGVGIALLNVAAVFGIYGLTRLIWKHQTAETKDLAGSVIFRVASLQGLILALVFAQELLDYSEIRADLVTEATAIADIYNDIRRYDAPEAPAVQQALADYMRHVVDVEWRTLAEKGKLTGQGWQYREVVYQAVLDLMPKTPREEDLRAHMVHKAQVIAELRQKRANNAVRSLSSLFWFAALTGVICVAVPYFTFAPTPLHLSLLSLYAAYTGVIMYVIFAFSDPFADPGMLPPTAFIELLDGEIGTEFFDEMTLSGFVALIAGAAGKAVNHDFMRFRRLVSTCGELPGCGSEWTGGASASWNVGTRADSASSDATDVSCW